MFLFTTPTVEARWNTGEFLTTLFSKQDRGVTVIRNGSVFTEKRFVSQDELNRADQFWLGGRTHEVSAADAAMLQAAGYTVVEV